MTSREELAAVTKKGVGLPLAGIVYWIGASVLFQALPMKRAALLAMLATGLVFPLGLLISRLLAADLFARRPPLSSLGGILALVQLCYWPVILLCYALFPVWMPFVLAVLFGSHFLPYGWLYQSRGYYFLGAAVPLAATAVALFGAAVSYTYTAPVVAVVYLLGSVQVLREVSSQVPATRTA